MEEVPVWNSRVQLDPSVKDYWGIPVARISGQKHPHTVQVAKFIAKKCEMWLNDPQFNLIVTNLAVGDMNAAQLASEVRRADSTSLSSCSPTTIAKSRTSWRAIRPPTLIASSSGKATPAS